MNNQGDLSMTQRLHHLRMRINVTGPPITILVIYRITRTIGIRIDAPLPNGLNASGDKNRIK